MTDEVRDSYDSIASEYAKLFIDDLDRDENARNWLARFGALSASQGGVVVDLGCGPGHVVNHLCELGLEAVGCDISPGQIAEARRAFPGLGFYVGDLANMGISDSSIGGIVSRYSLIHLLPSVLHEVFEEWMRVLMADAPILVSFFASPSVEKHATPFDHKVATAYELFPATVAHQLQDAGFSEVEVDIRPPVEGGRPLNHATILARKPAN